MATRLCFYTALINPKKYGKFMLKYKGHITCFFLSFKFVARLVDMFKNKFLQLISSRPFLVMIDNRG